MGAITTLATTVAVAAGAVALYRYIDRQTRELKKAISKSQSRSGGPVIDYERDPVSGVFRPKH